MNSNYRFPKLSRLLRKSDFDRVFAHKCSMANGPLVVYVSSNVLNHPRLGLVVSRKVGNAVVRNAWKRRLREAFRLTQHDLPGKVDVIVIPRGGPPEGVAALQQHLVEAVRRLHRRLDTGRQ